MNQPHHRSHARIVRQAHAVAALVGVVAIAFSAAAAAWNWSHAPPPFVWRDVALVYLLCLLPLAASLFVSITAWSATMIPVLLLEAAALIFVPRFYIHVRCANDAARIGGLVEQSRLGEANGLISRVLSLEPKARWQGVELREVQLRLEALVGEIERRTTAPLSGGATDEERLVRCRDLAMLGRTAEAIQTLDSSPGLLALAEARNLRGTIHESRGEWHAAQHWYGRAESAWRDREETTEKSAGLTRAYKGVAYCQRKLGRLHEAEAAYQALLVLSPTAETHFLLAQFYEDTQQARQARHHAREAIALAPKRYAQRGQRLMDKLVTSHFGCWGVFRSDYNSATPFGTVNLGNK